MFRYLKKVFFLLGNDKKKIPLIILLFILSSMLEIVGIGVIAPYISLFSDPNAAQELSNFANTVFHQNISIEQIFIYSGIVLTFIFLLKTIITLFVKGVIIRFSQKQQVRLRTQLMDQYQSLPYSEYISRNSAEYIHSIQNLAEQYASKVVQSFLYIISDGLLVIFILMLLAWTDLVVFLVLLALFLIISIGYDYFFSRNLKKHGELANSAATLMVKNLHEGIEGLKEIRVFGKEDYFYQNVVKYAEQYAHSHVKSQITTMAPRYIIEIFVVFFIVSMATKSFIFDKDLTNSLVTIGVFGVASLRLIPSVNMLLTSVTHLRFNYDVVERLFNDLRNIRPLKTRKGAIIINDEFEEIALKGVNFTYAGTDKKAIRDLSITIHSGDSIGFIGCSGSGKTTLIDIMLGLLEPQTGVIELNHIDIKNNMHRWREQVAYLPQQVFLIDDTLRNNIALGESQENIDDKRILKAIKKAKLTSLLEVMEQGLDTTLGERGVRLSGGQRQRVVLARAFYYERNILIMDESTSALDKATEKEIVKEIKSLKGKKTLIVIAHRLSTLEHCDKIYELIDGSLFDRGEYKDVV
jgi:ATP-binding cassette, subfamily B, bacterial PglK